MEEAIKFCIAAAIRKIKRIILVDYFFSWINETYADFSKT